MSQPPVPLSDSQQANYRNFKLSIQGNRACIQPTLQAKLSILLFGLMLLPLFLAIAFFAAIGELPIHLASVTTFILLSGSCLALLLWMYRRASVRKCFDRETGLVVLEQSKGPLSLPLEQIERLQVIRSAVLDNSSKFYTYQLNLVCRDGRRYPLMDHSRWEYSQRETEQLACFLGVEWDYFVFR